MKEKILTIKADKIHCDDCAKRAEKAMMALPGVDDVHTVMSSKRFQVRLGYQPSPSGEILQALANVGIRGTVEVMDNTVGIKEHGEQDSFFTLFRQQLLNVQLMSGVFLTAAIGLVVIFDEFFPTVQARFIMLGLTVPLVLWSSFPLYRGILNGPNKVDVLLHASVALLLALSISRTFGLNIGEEAPEFLDQTEVYYFHAAYTLLLMMAGKYLEKYLWRQAKRLETKLTGFKPTKIKRMIPGEAQDRKGYYVRLKDVKVGDHIQIKSQERIPFDGVITHGNSTVDESYLEGESIPRELGVGSRVVSGSLNQAGTIIVKVERVGEEMTLHKMLAALKKARRTGSRMQVLLDRLSWFLLPLIILITSGTFFGWYFAGEDLASSVLLSATVFLAASPYSLRIATSLAYALSLQKAATRGIMAKSVQNLEDIPQVKKILFTYLGILTRGRPEVTDILGGDRFKIAQMAGSLADHIDNSVSRAIALSAKQEGVNLSRNVRELKVEPGVGVEGVVDGRLLMLGSVQLIEHFEVDASGFQKHIQKLEEEGKIVVILMTRKEVLGVIGVNDELRHEVKNVVKRMTSRDIETLMVSAHNANSMRFQKNAIGLTNVVTEASPEERRKVIDGLNKQRHLALAVQKNDHDQLFTDLGLGVIIDRRDDEAFESDLILFLRDGMSRLPEVFDLAAQASRVVKQNIFWVFFYNAVAVFLALAGFIGPLLAVTLSALSPLVVLVNSLRLKNDPRVARLKPAKKDAILEKPRMKKTLGSKPTKRKDENDTRSAKKFAISNVAEKKKDTGDAATKNSFEDK